jgi:hypothetical protein
MYRNGAVRKTTKRDKGKAFYLLERKIRRDSAGRLTLGRDAVYWS